MHADSLSGWTRYLRFLPGVILGLSLLATHQLSKNAQIATSTNLQFEFEFLVREARDRIQQRLIAYEYVLRGAQGMFVAADDVDRNAYHNYVTNLHLEDNYPGIQGVGFAQIITPEQREAHVMKVRKEVTRPGYPEYNIWPQGEREFYTSIIYLEPFSGRNLRAFGYDMYSEPVRRAAMERARDTGKASMSGKVLLVQETQQDVQAGFLVYLPVYKRGVVPSTVQERRANLIGWVYSPFRMKDLMNGIEGGRGGEIDIEIYDGNAKSDMTLMYDSGVPEHVSPRFMSTSQIDSAGHSWTTYMHSNAPFEARVGSRFAEIIALTGTIASLLLALLTWSLTRGRARAEEAARRMNMELIQSEERARLAISASHAAYWDLDVLTGRVYLSEGWSQLLGGDQRSTTTTIQELAALVPLEEHSRVREAILNAIKGHVSSSYQVVHRVRKPDGAYIWVNSEGEVTKRDKNGRALRMIGTNRDVTERIVAERNLQELNADLDATLRAIPDLLFELSQEGKYLQVWTRSPEFLVDSKERLIGHNVYDVLPAEAAGIVMAAIREAGERGYSHGQIINLPLPQGDSWFELSTSEKVETSTSDKSFIMLSRDITERKKSEESLRKLSQAIEQSPSSVIITDIDANIEYVNDAFVKITGYSSEEVIGKNPRMLSSGKTPRIIYTEMWDCLNNGQMWTGEFINRRKDGCEYIEAVRMSPVRQSDGSITHFLAVKNDITERKLSDEKLARSEASLRAILDNVPYLIWLKDAESRFVAVNRSFFKTTKLASMDDVVGKSDFDLWPKELAEKYRADDAEVMSTREQKLTEEMSLDGDKPFWVETFKAPILDKDGRLIGTTGFARDITERKHSEEMMLHMAHYDTLTDLPNRAMLSDRIEQALMKAKREKASVAVVLIDLDKFKPINDTYGHEVGDQLLQEAAKRMRECVRESDTVARLGGDEFVVLLPEIETGQDAVQVAEKILQTINQPFNLAGKHLEISASMGISIYPEHGDKEVLLLKNADVAMYQIKQGGRSGIRIYDEKMGSHIF